VSFDPQKGIIRVQLGFSPLEGKAIVLLPSLDAKQQVVWRCTSSEVQQRYLPQACRELP
jgi:hypothetical protein